MNTLFAKQVNINHCSAPLIPPDILLCSVAQINDSSQARCLYHWEEKWYPNTRMRRQFVTRSRYHQLFSECVSVIAPTETPIELIVQTDLGILTTIRIVYKPK